MKTLYCKSVDFSWFCPLLQVAVPSSSLRTGTWYTNTQFWNLIMNTGYREFDDFSSMAGKWNSVRASFGGGGRQLPLLGIYTLVCKHTDLDCYTPKIFQYSIFALSLNKISKWSRALCVSPSKPHTTRTCSIPQGHTLLPYTPYQLWTLTVWNSTTV